MEEEKKVHGGRRPGAGRKPKPKAEKMERYMVRFDAETLERIRAKAAEKDLSVSEFIRRAVQEKL